MNLYRWFKTQVYWLIPDSFKSTDPNNEFVGTTDLMTIYKVTDQGEVYENRNVTLNELAGLIGGGEQGPTGPMGPQGPAGPAVPSGLNWQGEYASETSYALNDVVTWTNPATSILGSYWVTDEAGVYNIAPTNGSGVINEGWAFLASQGAQGIQGPAGPTGATGPQGPAGTTGAYKEVFLRTNYLSSIEYGYSTLTTNTLTAVTVSTGVYRINIQNTADRPANAYKIEVNADVIASGVVGQDIYRVAVDANVTSATGIITFYIYKFDSGTQEFVAAAPNTGWHPVHIRIYN